MEIVDNKALLLDTPSPQQVLTVIPKSKQVGADKVLVHWGLDETQVLRNLGFQAPSPIRNRYMWPGQHAPFDHQRTTAEFLTLHRKAFCFNEQGTGKSAAVIWAADYLMSIGRIRRALIICPISIMDSAWRSDLFKVAMHRSVDIAYGGRDVRRAVINSHSEFVIINYDGVEIVADDIDRAGFDLIVVDEASAYKTATTKRWKALHSLIKPTTWLWMLTGTPAAQSPLDAYGLAKLVNPKNVPPFFTAFKDMVMTKVSMFKWIPKANATDLVFRALQPAIRFTKAECLDLPEIMYVRRDVELTKQQQKYYNLLKNKLIVEAAGEEIVAKNAAIAMSKLLQISSGAVYSDTKEVIEFDISNRYKVLTEIIDESSQKVLIFVPFKHTINALTNKLSEDGYTNAVISGDVSAGDRTVIFNAFQSKPDPRVLVIQPQSAAHGVTLTAANTIVWWGPVPSLETYAQANARIHRAGQKHACTVFQLAGSNVERHIYKLLDGKLDVHSRIVELYKEILV